MPTFDDYDELTAPSGDELALVLDAPDGVESTKRTTTRTLAEGIVGPPLVLYAQAGLPGVDGAAHYVDNAATWATLPWDGLALYSLSGANGVFNRTADLTSGTVTGEWAGFHEAAWGARMRHHWALLRIQFNSGGLGAGGGDVPAYDNDTHWARIKANATVWAAGIKGPLVKGVMLDNEHYHDAGPSLFDWVSGGGITPTQTLAQAQAQAYQRGRELMEGLIAGWPEIKVVALHGPYISDPRTGAEVWTDQATDPPYWNPVSTSNELSAWFTWGMAEAAMGTRAEVIDGGEVYAARTVEHYLRVRHWQLDGLANGNASTIVPEWLRGGAYPLGATFGLMDNDEFAAWAEHPLPTMQAMLARAMRVSQNGARPAPMVWHYVESRDPFPGGMPGNTDESWRPFLSSHPSGPTAYVDMVTAAIAAGRPW